MIDNEYTLICDDPLDYHYTVHCIYSIPLNYVCRLRTDALSDGQWLLSSNQDVSTHCPDDFILIFLNLLQLQRYIRHQSFIIVSNDLQPRMDFCQVKMICHQNEQMLLWSIEYCESIYLFLNTLHCFLYVSITMELDLVGYYGFHFHVTLSPLYLFLFSFSWWPTNTKRKYHWISI